MKVSQRIAAIALTLVLGLCACSGDSGRSASSDSTAPPAPSQGGAAAGGEEPVKLTYYCAPGYLSVNNQIVELFQKDYPHVTVEFVELPTDSNQQFQTLSTVMQAQDNSLDIFELDCTWPQTFISAGWVENLDNVFAAGELEEHFEGSASVGHYQGSQYTLPIYINTGTLFYRTDLLENYGYDVPETWDELVEISQDIMSKEPDITSGFSSAWKPYEGLVCSAMEFFWAYGGEVVDDDGNVLINSPENAAALQKMYDMIYTDKIVDPAINGYMWVDSRAPFFSGNTLFIRDWPTTINGANDPEKSQVAGNVGFAPLPRGPSGQNYNTMGGWQIAVSAFSDNKEIAKLLVKHMASYEAQKIRAIENSHIPSRLAVMEDPEVLEAVPFFTDLIAVGADTKARPRTAYYEELSSVLQQGINSVLSNVQDIPTALSTMETQIKEIMSR